MKTVFHHLRSVALVCGVIGGAFLGGYLSQRPGHSDAAADRDSLSTDALREGFFKANSLHASAAMSHDALVMATGEVDNGLDAIFLLDGLTGELRGGVINNNTRKFVVQYSYAKILQDLGADTVKNPKFLMVTGELGLTQGRGTRMGRSALYIAELNSGVVAAYGVPWDQTRYANNQTSVVGLIPLDRFKFRETMLRPQ